MSMRRFCFSVGVILILLSLSLCWLFPQVVVAKSQFLANAWPKNTGAPVNSSPVLGDLDGDGILEIVVGSDNHKVYAWKPDGTLMPGWPVSTGDSVRSSPALADIDNDGRLDVIVGSFDNKVYAWNFNGSLLPGWPAVTGSVVYSSPAVGDIDGDQLPEIVVGSFDNKVYAWNADGTLARGWPKPTGLFVYSSPSLADIDNDGLPEVIVGTDNNRVFAWNGDGTEVEGWPTATEHVVPSSPAIGDIDNDGGLEIVVGSWDKVFVWNSRGERKPGWPVMAGHQIPSSPALADLNNDGKLEIITGCKDGRVYAWDAAGRLLPGWPTVTDAEISSSPAVADLNGDGVLEVIIGSKDSKVYVWDAEGRLLPGWPKNTTGSISSSPAIGDLDQDGTFELVIGSKDHKVYVWSFPRTGQSSPKAVWQNFHGNPSHTGVYGIRIEPTYMAEPQYTPEMRVIDSHPVPPGSQGQDVSLPSTRAPITPDEIKDGYVNDLIISDYDKTSVTLTWTAPPGIRTPQTVYDIRYSPQPVTEENWEKAARYPAAFRPAATGSREIYQLANLQTPDNLPAEMLYFALKVGEGARVSSISNVVRLERQDNEPPAKIQEIHVTELTDLILELSWKATGDNSNVGTASTYDIRYSDTPLNESTWERATRIENEPAPLPAGTDQRLQVKKPWNDREIFWGIKAIDESLNTSELSEVAVWGPRDEIPPSRIVDLRVTKISGTNVILTWTAPGNNLNVGKAQGYDIRYAAFPLSEVEWASATPVADPPLPEKPGSPQTYTLPGISIGTTAYVGIKTVDSNGNIAALSNVVETAMDDVIPPTAVTDLKIDKVGKDWAQVSWTASGDDDQQGVAAAYVLRYGGNFRVVKSWSNAIDVQQLPTPSETGATEAVVITGLNENSTYYVGLRVLDSQGNSSGTSNILRVKTFGRSTPEAVTDLVIEELRPDGVTLNWSAPQDFGEEASKISGYDIRYALAEITEDTWNSAKKFRQVPAPSIPETLETVTVKGGPRETAYYIALKSYDALGNASGLSNVLHIPRVDTVPPDPVIDLFVEESGKDWIRIIWTATGEDKQAGQASTQLIRIAPKLRQLKEWNPATEIPNTLQPSPAGMKDSFTITGLKSNSTFFVAVKSVDGFSNVSEMSNIVRGKTKDAVPPAAIRDLEYVGLEDDAIVLQWTAPGENGMEGRAKAYDVRYSQEPITSASWKRMPIVPLTPAPAQAGKTQKMTVPGLEPNTKYYFSVVTIDASENLSPLSNVVSAYTADTAAPESITTLSVENVESSSVLLNWTSPGDDETHDTPDRYDIRYARKPLNVDSWSQANIAEESIVPSAKGKQEDFLLSGLKANSTYYIGMKAVDASGNASEISNIVQVYMSKDSVTDLAILDFSAQTVTLTWTTPGGVLTERMRNYDIRYATTMISEETWSEAIPLEILSQDLTVKQPGSKEKFELSSLPPYEQMFFAVRVGGAGQLPGLSNVVELNRLDIIPPGIINTLQVRDLGRTSTGMQSLELTWEAPGDNEFDGTASKYEVHYGTTPPKAENWESLTRVQEVPSPQIARTQQHMTIQIPPGEDTLYFAMRTYDEALNISNFSNVAQWAPEDTIAPSRIIDLRAERLSNGDIKVSWTAPGDNENRGIAAFYDIRYALKKSGIEKWGKAMTVPGEPLPEVAGTQQEYTITGLQGDKAYYIAVKAIDDVKNISEVSNILEVSEMSLEQIRDLAFVGGTDTTVTLSWTAPRNRVPTGRIIRYEIRYSENESTVEQWRRAKKIKQGLVPREAGSTESLVVEKLFPNKRYYFAVRFIDHTGDIAKMSNIVAAYTSDTIPPKPLTDLTVQKATKDSVTLMWTVREDDDLHNTPALYDLRYSLEPINEANWDSAITVEEFEGQALQPSEPGKQIRYTIAGLEENTRYHVNVRAIDAGGNISPLSNVMAAQTKDVTPPLAITDLRAMLPTSNSVMLSWICPSDVVSGGGRAVADRDIAMSGLAHEDTLIDAYDIRYIEMPFGDAQGNPLDEQSWANASKVLIPPKPLTPGTIQEFVVRGLEPAKSYYFAIKVIDQSENFSTISNTVLESTLPAELTVAESTRSISPTGDLRWELIQGKEIGEIQQDNFGGWRIKKKEGTRASTPDTAITAVYPQASKWISIPQRELSFRVKSSKVFTLCAKVNSMTGEEPYYLCYTPEKYIASPLSSSTLREITPVEGSGVEGPALSGIEEPGPSEVKGQARKRIENYVFYFLDPAILDNEWHEIRVNLSQDLLEGTGQIYRDATRFSVRGTQVALTDMVMMGAVDSSVADFEKRANPLETGWKLHFGTGIVQLGHDEQGNTFLYARSETGERLVLTYPKDGTLQLSDKPVFLANVRAGNDIKVILKVRARDNREYYLAYLPQTAFQESTSSGNYIYLPLQIMIDEETSAHGNWMQIQANIKEDLRRNHLEYAYTSWISFHGAEFSLDNVRFSTEILETVLE